MQRPDRAARILQRHDVTGLERPQPCALDLQHRDIVRGRNGAAVGGEEYFGWPRDTTIGVSVGPYPQHLRPWFQLPCPHLWPGDVHHYPALPPHFLLRPSQVLDHREPRWLRVVGAVDPHDVHPCCHHVSYEGVVYGCLTRHRRHHPYLSSRFALAEQRLGVRSEDFPPFHRRNPVHGRFNHVGFMGEPLENSDYCVNIV